jgi:dTDP-4-amino-4,6-dideoxygalactose transaminase
MEQTFTGSFTQQEPIPEDAIAAAVAVMRSGRLHRYNTAPGEASQTALLEQEFAAQTGAKYCLAVASGGYAIATALRAQGVQHGDPVLTNAFTLAPVPGAIASVGGQPVFVGITPDLRLDFNDLADKARASGARVLLLSHMRGHLCDMPALMRLCDDLGLIVIEDCAHTMGADWDGIPSGRFGAMGCFSMQTYKHINSGEGGFLIGDDAQAMARAVMMSGSYMLYETHLAAPAPDVFEGIKYHTPNISGRMDNLRAAILRPQLADLPTQVARWNDRYRTVEAGLADTPGLRLIPRPVQEHFVGSSIQFLLMDWSDAQIEAAIAGCAARGVELKWFGAAQPKGFTSRYDSWRYAPAQSLPGSDRVLRAIVDMRLPLTFSLQDCTLIAQIIAQEVAKQHQG